MDSDDKSGLELKGQTILHGMSLPTFHLPPSTSLFVLHSLNHHLMLLCCVLCAVCCGLWAVRCVLCAGASVPERLNELYKLSELMVQKQLFTAHQHFLLTGQCARALHTLCAAVMGDEWMDGWMD
jgi:hypothetical protein